MKKIFLLLSLLGLLSSNAQEFTETFEGNWTPGLGPGTGPQGQWGIYENGSGVIYNWSQSALGNTIQPPYEGNHAAYLNKESVAEGLAEDWLVTPFFVVPENAQLRFYSRLTLQNNQGNSFEIYISTDADQDAWENYSLLAAYTEDEINPVYNQYTEVVIDLPASYFGLQSYIALVMKNNNGDRWLVDNFSVLQKCISPTGATVPQAGIGATTATIEWDPAVSATTWEIELLPSTQNFTGIPSHISAVNSLDLEDLTPATIYHFRVRAQCANGLFSDWSTTVNFQTAFAVPANDECSQATELVVNPGPQCATAMAGQLASATSSPQQNPCNGTADDDVWFHFQATASQHIITLSAITGGNSNVYHTVYSGSCASAESLYCSTAATSNAINLVAGEDYYIRVYSESADPQQTVFTICVTTPPPPPVNDNCENAAEVPVNSDLLCTVGTVGTVYSATPSPQPNTCQGFDDDDVWFTFTATSTSHIISLTDIEGSTPNLFHSIYQGSDCDSLNQLYCSNPESSTATNLTVGQTYTIRVYTFTGNPGQTTTFTLCITTPPPPPVNDQCANALSLTVNNDLSCISFTDGSLVSATASGLESTCPGTADDDVWFRFTATSTIHTILLFDLEGSTLNLCHSLFTGTCGAMQEVFCSDPNSSTFTGYTEGQEYYVRVYSHTAIPGQTTVFKVCVGTPPAPPLNDKCQNATNVPVNSSASCAITVPGTLLAATVSEEFNECPGSADDDVWYEFTATNSAHSITIGNIQGSAPDLVHALYLGDSCNALSHLYCSDQDNSYATGLTPGTTYRIRVYSVTGLGGQDTNFTVCVTTPPPPPANDACTDAQFLQINPDEECTLFTAGTIQSATPSGEILSCEGVADDDVWFEFTALYSLHSIRVFDVEGSTTALMIGLYKGESCEALEPLYCTSGNESLAAGLIPGHTYKIRVFSFTDQPGQDSTFSICITTPSQPLSVSDGYTPEQLVSEVLISSSCAQVDNIVSRTGTDFGSVNGIAYFERSSSDFPIRKGVILSSGRATDAPGPNSSSLSQGNGAWPGDQELLEYITSLAIDPELVAYLNASVLEFDFVPLTDHVSFPFIFASEEYGTYQCEYSDAFAFFLTNTETGEVTNLAVLPGTEIPVSVVTIRDDSNAECEAVNPEYFAQMNFGDNLDAAINFNGNTVLLTAAAAVIPNTVYRIKLVVADRNDGILDSAVFIGPFDIGGIDLGNDLLVDDLTALCQGESYTIHSGLDPEFYEITWFYNGAEIPGETAPQITISLAGIYTIEAYYIPSSCTSTQSIIVEYYPLVNETTGNPANLVHCDASQTLFDLSENTDAILEGLNADLFEVSYHASADDAAANQDPLATVHTIQGIEQVLYVRIRNLLTDCIGIKYFTLSLLDLNQYVDLIAFCQREGYGINVMTYNFDASTAAFHWLLPDGSSALEKDLIIDQTGTYILRVVTPQGCELYSTITIDTLPVCMLPKGISPNGDGLNDSFDLEGFAVTELSVFNRYGQQVYHFAGEYTDQWHGQGDDDDLLPTGTYFYQIRRKSGPELTGWVYSNTIP